MSTVTRPELSKRNKYYISKHRYYELKHFCLQYPEWKMLLQHSFDVAQNNGDLQWSDPTGEKAIFREHLQRKIKLVEAVAYETDEIIGSYILKAVTEDLSYTFLKTKLDMPCGRDSYFNLYRRYFYLLDSHF
ncbi:MAG: hypothetical protein J6U54_05375 [Clostridiales bacterium]|nr:hypothetical protein [Clostridiales bacterium]